ncbi:MAG TPA: DUF4192 family protein [Arachnia sp.]|nr:DUF4192 family protein [Arachnia sp.]
MSSTPVLRGTTRADLLAMPSVLLGFHPTNSCVVMGLCGATVAFCARLEVDWFVHHFDDVADQIINASSQVEACRFVIIGYGDPDLAGLAVTELASVVGEARVIDALVTDGRSTWALDADLEAHVIESTSSSLEAQAVYQGIRICGDRGEAVAPVELHNPAPRQEVEAAEALVSAMSPEEGMDVLEQLAESPVQLNPREACLLSVLLEDEDHLGALLARLSMDTADRMWPHLVSARQAATPQSEANILALLGIASWLSGRGAAQTSCLEQLARIHPGHELGRLLARVHRDAIPPRRWDE